MLADLAVAIADGAEVISDFAVVRPSGATAWPGRLGAHDLADASRDRLGALAQARITREVNAARRPGVGGDRGPPRRASLACAIADKILDGVTCIRPDATVTPAHSDKELAEPNFKGFGHHPLPGYCDNTGEPLAGMMRRGSAGSNTTADHLQVLGDAITAPPPKHRRRLMVTADGAGASHGLITRLDQLAARPGHH